MQNLSKMRYPDGRAVSDSGLSHHRDPWLCLWAGISLAFLLTVSGCTPYPMYTHRPADAASEGDGARSRTPPPHPVSTQDESRIPDRPGVDPGIFTRVVEQYIGLPYKKGGDDEKGYDCSHLVRNVYRDYSGTRLPASTRALFQLPEEVTREELVVGDLLFFSFDDVTISHVGIYMGGGRFVHASESRGVVKSSLSDPEYREAYKGARRVL